MVYTVEKGRAGWARRGGWCRCDTCRPSPFGCAGTTPTSWPVSFTEPRLICVGCGRAVVLPYLTFVHLCYHTLHVHTCATVPYPCTPYGVHRRTCVSCGRTTVRSKRSGLTVGTTLPSNPASPLSSPSCSRTPWCSGASASPRVRLGQSAPPSTSTKTY